MMGFSKEDIQEMMERLILIETSTSLCSTALVEDGDEISIDVYAKTVTLHVSDEELARRREKWSYKPRRELSGYLARYARLVSSADRGAILD